MYDRFDLENEITKFFVYKGIIEDIIWHHFDSDEAPLTDDDLRAKLEGLAQLIDSQAVKSFHVYETLLIQSKRKEND